MKQFLLCSLLFSMLIGCAAPGEAPEQMIAAAKELDAKWLNAYNNGDADAVMATYWNSPELISYPPGELEMRGWDAIKAGFAKDFAMSPRGKLEMLETNYKPAGEFVVSWGKWRYTMADPPMEIVGRYSDVKANRGGKWVFIMDHASAPLPPPPAPGS